jgi:lysophospholipase L1-like esterase
MNELSDTHRTQETASAEGAELNRNLRTTNMHRTMSAVLFAFCALSIPVAHAGEADPKAFVQPKVHELKPQDVIWILGDSTTADGVHPAGYVRLVEQAIQEQLPDHKIVVIGKGVPMKKSRSLGPHVETIKALAKADPKSRREQMPTVVIFNYGLNDQGFTPATNALEVYTENIRQAITELQAVGVTPMPCATTARGSIDRMPMKPYADATRAVAAELKCPFIDLHSTHVAHILTHSDKDGRFALGMSPTRDGTHLTSRGETLSATAILRAFGLKPEWRKYQLRVSPGHATKVTADPAQTLYEPGTKVTLTAEIPAGFEFRGWVFGDGIPVSTEKTVTITMDRHIIIWPDVVKPR